jgi:hypothetical protein
MQGMNEHDIQKSQKNKQAQHIRVAKNKKAQVKRLESFEVLYTIGFLNEGVALNLSFPLPS